MRLSDQFRSVRHTFVSKPGRTGLTLLGIMIGAGSIVMLAGLLRGGEEALLRTSQRANEADLIQIRGDDPPAAQMACTRRSLSERDEESLGASRLLPGATFASEGSREVRAVWHDKKKRVRIVGASQIALPLYHLDVEKGRFFDDDDLALRRRVCVGGQEVGRELPDERASLDGVEFAADGQVWTVIGVLKD